jgi:predicted RNA-binding Zn-ribbon protein involved in translation (DUF1610 family)
VSIRVTCSECGKTLLARDTAAGKKARCPGCSAVIEVPAAACEAENAALGVASAVPDADGLIDIEAFEVTRDDGDRRPCPMCGEMIRTAARRCRFCGEVFQSDGAGSSAGRRRSAVRRTAPAAAERRSAASGAGSDAATSTAEATDGAIINCECGAAVRLPGKREKRTFRCPRCKVGIPLTADAQVLRATPIPTTGAPVVCTICHSQVEAQEVCVTCPSCEQVHHRECWTEIGGCGTYGCQQAPPVDKSEHSVQAPLTAWGDVKRCPACGEMIKSIALRCRYCDTEFDTVDPLTKADLRKQARRQEEVRNFKMFVIVLFIVSLLSTCLAPLVAIVNAVVILPRRETLRRCGPAFMVMGYTALGLTVVYTIAIALFMLVEMMS